MSIRRGEHTGGFKPPSSSLFAYQASGHLEVGKAKEPLIRAIWLLWWCLADDLRTLDWPEIEVLEALLVS